MAKHVLTDCGIYFAGYDFTGIMNQAEFTIGRDEVEATTFGDTVRNFQPGFLTAAFTSSGYFDATLAGIANVNLGAAAESTLIVAPTDTEGDPALIMAAELAQVTWGGTVGDMTPIDLRFGTRRDAGRGRLMFKRSITASANSSIVQLGALASNQTLLMAVTTTAATTGTSPTMSLTVFSDDSAGFASPTSRGAVTPLGAVRTAEIVRIDGPITDDYWRINAFVTGTSPVYQVAVALAIITNQL